MTHQTRKGFTLIELLVVVAIIALLVAILLPSLARAKEIANTIVCGNRHKACFIGWEFYNNDFGKRMAWWDDRTDPGNFTYQLPLTMWYYVQGESLPGRVYNGGFYNIAREDYEGFWLPGIDSPDQCPNYQCTEVEKLLGILPVELDGIYNENIVTLSYAMARDFDEQRQQWYTSPRHFYPKPDAFTHPSTSLLLVCHAGTSGEDRANVWTSYQPNIIANMHGGKSNYLFDDGHVETLKVDPSTYEDAQPLNETNSLMWCPRYEPGQEKPES